MNFYSCEVLTHDQEKEKLTPVYATSVNVSPWSECLNTGGPCCDMRIYASLGGGLYWFVFSPFCLGRCISSLFICKFPFVDNKVSQVFNGVLVYFFHERFNACLWDFKVG